MSFPSGDQAGSSPFTPSCVNVPPDAGSVPSSEPSDATSVVASGDQSTDLNAPRAATRRLSPLASTTTMLLVETAASSRPSGLQLGDHATPRSRAGPPPSGRTKTCGALGGAYTVRGVRTV